MAFRRYQKPAVLRRIPTDRSAVIEASAGTGKTYTLEHLLIELILVRQLPIERILVVTFTEKATGELVARVRKKLVGLLAGDWKEPAPAIADEDCWIVDAAARERLAQALSMFDSATISTIHSFCQRVLTEHAFTHERLFDQTQVKDEDAFALAFKTALRTRFAVEPAFVPWLEALLSAGWSTADLEQHLLACWRAPGALRPLFDEAALTSALQRFPKQLDLDLLAAGLSPMHGSTRKAVIARIVDLAAIAERFSRAQDLVSVFGELDGKREWLFEYLDDRLPQAVAANDTARAVQDGYARIAAAAAGLEVVAASLFLPVVKAQVEQQKRAAGQFDFQDMLTLVAQSLDGPRGAELIAGLRERYACALIDEFQDTDEIQWSIFKRVFFDSGQSHPLLVIGDPKQAIYGFRGADVQTYVAARAAIEATGGPVVVLDENFRSTPPLIDAYNAIFAERPGASFFSGGIRYDVPVRAGRPDLSAIDGSRTTPASIHLLCPDPRVELSAGEIRDALGRRIADEIRTLLDAGPRALRFGERGAEESLAASDIYVLTASAKAGYEMADHLRASGIPFAFFKQDGLFQRDEARDVLALLSAIADPHDRSKRAQAWLSPFFDLSLSELADCRELPGAHPLMQRLFDWRAIGETHDYERLFARIMADSGIVRRALFFSESERELTNYLHLFELLLEEANRSRCTVKELARTLGSYIGERDRPEGADENVQRLETERQAVQILTIHKSKGLEAAVVFLYGAFADPPTPGLRSYRQDGRRLTHVGPVRDPNVQRLIAEEAEEEAQRLYYVAITRAKARLYLPYFHTLDAPPAPPAPAGQPAAEPAKGKKKAPKQPAAPSGPVESFKRLGVAYTVLNRRLREIWNANTPGFEREQLPLIGALAPTPLPAPQALSGWQPDRSLLSTRDEGARYQAMKPRHAGFIVTSYTRLKSAQGGYHSATGDLAEAAAPAAESPELRPARGADELAGGKASGIFLHAVLEELSFPELRAIGSLEDFMADPAVREIFERKLRKYDRDPRQLPHAKRLVHAGLFSPIALPSGRRLENLVAAERVAQEMEFIYPIPEAMHPSISDALGAGLDARRFSVERGFIKGYIDLIFEHEGLVYVLDWKSDSLPSWEAATVAAHVEENYRLQAKLYSLALVKLLRVHDEASYQARFGGFVYTFLRGMAAEGGAAAGVFGERPAWSTVLAWEAELRQPSLPVFLPRGRA